MRLQVVRARGSRDRSSASGGAPASPGHRAVTNRPGRLAPIVVHKFGGTSLGNSERIAAASQILLRAARNERIVAVVSATAGTTNALLEAAESARSGHASRWRATLDAIRDRHLRLARAVAAGLVRAKREIPSNPRGANARGEKSNGALA